MTTLDYLRDGKAIYEQSFATIRAEADLGRVPSDLEKVAVRMIHACGMVDLVDDLDWSPGVGEIARAALGQGASVLCDSQMVARGITRSRLPADNPVLCTLTDAEVAPAATAERTTRSAAAVDRWRDHLEGSIVAIGNAPTALFRLLELLADGVARPAMIIGVPVGFMGAAESKLALSQSSSSVPFITVHGRRGGSALAVAAVNALATERE